MENKNLAAEDIKNTREKIIVRTSTIGITANILLAVFKAVVGFAANSIAIILDGVNNLSDALSSVITIIGAKLGAKLPDREHPLGHGRIEYVSSMAVAAIVLYAGITAFIESVKKIISPQTADYSAASLIVIITAIIVKLILGTYVKKQGKKVKSGALIASGSDASFDALLSVSVLAAAIIYLRFGISLEAFVGVLISIFVMKTGFEIMVETMNDIIGQRGEAELSKEIRRVICQDSRVIEVCDLVLFNYGPDKNYVSVSVELPDTMTVSEADRITRNIKLQVYRETGVIITGVGIYSYNTSDSEVSKIRDEVQKKLKSYDWVLQMHGFYADTEKRKMCFDVVLSFDVTKQEAIDTIHKAISEVYPDYDIQIEPDPDSAD